MRKWLLSALAVLTALLLDTAVIPVFYTGPYRVQVLLVLTFAYGMEGGFVTGLLTGLIAGILADISAGGSGDLLFAAMGTGLAAGLIARYRTDVYSRRLRSRAYRLLRAFSIALLVEGGILFYRYYQVGTFNAATLWPMAARAFLLTVLAYAVSAPVRHILYGGWRSRTRGAAGEEKNY